MEGNVNKAIVRACAFSFSTHSLEKRLFLFRDGLFSKWGEFFEPFQNNYDLWCSKFKTIFKKSLKGENFVKTVQIFRRSGKNRKKLIKIIVLI